MGAFYLFPRCGLDEALGFAIRPWANRAVNLA
jgi:hypothetical protein